MSDLHHRYNEIVVPEGDLLVLAGDLTMMGTVEQIITFNSWLRRQDFKHKIVIPGNHDWLFQTDLVVAAGLIRSDPRVHLLIDKQIEIDGLKVWGSPWQPWFYDWAFNLRRGLPIKEKWDLIPDDTDILVTHGPPHGVLDQTDRFERVGCEELMKAVLRVKPKLHVFGHIHAGYGTMGLSHLGAFTRFVNASICTEAYEPTNPPIVIDL